MLDFYGPGVWFAEVSTFSELPRGHDAEAYAGGATVLHLPSPDLEALLADQPALGRAFLRLEALRLQLLLAALESYSTRSLEQRLASRLLMLAGPFGVPSTQGIKIELHLSQETLAQLIGATRQRVNQIVQEWELDGSIEHEYGRIVLVDQARIERRAET